MLVYSISPSADGFVTDREGSLDWGTPSDEVTRAHHNEVAELGAYLLGRRLYETMLVWETDPAMRETESGAAFADIWAALPKVVFSRTLDSLQGNARLARAPLAEEVAAALATAQGDVSIGGADLAGQAIHLDLVDELRIYRHPVLLGAGTPHLPPLSRNIPLQLAEVQAFDSGVIFERYRRAR